MSHKETLKLLRIKKADCLRKVHSGKIGKMKQIAHFTQLIRHHHRFYRDLIRYSVFTKI